MAQLTGLRGTPGPAGRGHARQPAGGPRRGGRAGRAPAAWPAGWPAASFVVAAEIAAPDDGMASRTTDAVLALREQGVDLFAVTAPEHPRAHRDSLGMALHLQQHAAVEAIVTMTTWDKTIMTLQADLLGGARARHPQRHLRGRQPAGARRLPGRGRRSGRWTRSA